MNAKVAIPRMNNEQKPCLNTVAGALLLACDLLDDYATGMSETEREFVQHARELAEGGRPVDRPAELVGGVVIHCPGCRPESCACVAR